MLFPLSPKQPSCKVKPLRLQLMVFLAVERLIINHNAGLQSDYASPSQTLLKLSVPLLTFNTPSSAYAQTYCLFTPEPERTLHDDV